MCLNDSKQKRNHMLFCLFYVCIYIVTGLYQLADALAFVHNDLGMIHGCVCPSSIFVTKAGDWKLGGFELAHAYKDVPIHFSSNFDLLPTRYKPKELTENQFENLNNNPINSLDSWSLGCLIQEIFNGRFEKPQQLSNLEDIPAKLQPHYKRLLANKVMSCCFKYTYTCYFLYVFELCMCERSVCICMFACTYACMYVCLCGKGKS